MDKDELIKEVVLVIRRYLSENRFKIFLFGSSAKDSAGATSDIDIGILGDTVVEEAVMFRIKEEVKAIPTLRSVDIVDLAASDEGFRREALSNAKQL